MDIKYKRIQELKEKITDLEKSLSELKKELRDYEKKAQHEAIDNLELHLEKIDHKYENLRNFWSLVVNEFKVLIRKSSKEDKGSN